MNQTAAVVISVLLLTTGSAIATTNAVSLDRDNLTPVEEYRAGTDPFDEDSDGDGLSDSREMELGTDPVERDSDGDTLSDEAEVRDYGTNPLGVDTDGDELGDGDERDEHGTDPTSGDTDGDGLDDGSEVDDYRTDPLNEDTDNDGFGDGEEIHELSTDPTKPDTDGDGFPDRTEVNELETDPTASDTDSDGLDDYREIDAAGTDPTNADTDSDGLDDGPEVDDHGTDPLADDTDGDGLDDGTEVIGFGSDPQNTDTDADGIGDNREVRELGTSPTKSDSDDDGLDDLRELEETGTDPANADTDGDGLPDGSEVDYESPVGEGNPLRVDIFVELDYMEGEKPALRALSLVELQFRNSPVKNVDGSTGISLHIITDEQIPHESSTWPSEIDDLQRDNFDNSGYGYHYGVSVNDVEERELTIEIDDRTIGTARPSSHAFIFEVNFPDGQHEGYDYLHEGQAGILMHELGHSIGLSGDGFDGIDSTEYGYTEYTSVMNYNSPFESHQFNEGEPFDDWKHISENLETPSTYRLDP